MEINMATINSKKDPTTVAVEEPISKWSSQPKCINLALFVDRAKRYSHLVADDGQLVHQNELERVEKNDITHFVLEKRSRRICRSARQ